MFILTVRVNSLGPVFITSVEIYSVGHVNCGCGPRDSYYWSSIFTISGIITLGQIFTMVVI